MDDNNDNKLSLDVKRPLIYEPVMRGQVGRPPKMAIRPLGRPLGRPLHRLSSGSRSSGGRHPSVCEDPEERERQEERRRRNRESAAKCRQKLKDKLETCQQEVRRLNGHYQALTNERLLLDIEYHKTMHELDKHTRLCKGTDDLQEFKHKLMTAVYAPDGHHYNHDFYIKNEKYNGQTATAGGPSHSTAAAANTSDK